MVDKVSELAAELISSQVAIARRLQNEIIEALDRNDAQATDRLISSLDKAFSTFMGGIQTMGIDVSGLKDVLKAASTNTDVISALGDRLATVEGQLKNLPDGAVMTNLTSDVSDIKTKVGQLDAEKIESLVADVSDLKDALKQLTEAVAPKTP